MTKPSLDINYTLSFFMNVTSHWARFVLSDSGSVINQSLTSVQSTSFLCKEIPKLKTLLDNKFFSSKVKQTLTKKK